MADQVEFKSRVASPNLEPGTRKGLSSAPYLVASLKGNAGLTLQSISSTVELRGEFGIEIDGAATLQIEILRSLGGGTPGVIYSQLIELVEGGTRFTMTASHVDSPKATGPVQYFLQVREVGDSEAYLNLPVTFTGTQYTPV